MYQSRACVELDSRAISMRELFSAGTKLIPHFSAHNPAKHFRDLIFLVGFDIEYCFPSWMLVCGSRPSSFPLPLDPPPPPSQPSILQHFAVLLYHYNRLMYIH